ncbi:MAG: hypothetical protein WBE72_18495 [Terracidiphilus sp.]
METVLLRGGGHIAELRLAEDFGPAINCLWSAPWPTADPGDPEFAALAARYGSAPAGAFLAGYTGHALCLDIFGPPSREESARGVPLHGEASASEWDFEPTANGCVCRVELPAAQLGFERSVSLAENAAVLFVEERVENRGFSAREIHWVQHLSLGPPFLALACSAIHASLDRAITWPLGYEGRERLAGDACFEWPHAPAQDGAMLDLRIPFERAGYGFVAAARVDAARRLAYIAALNWQLGLALIYCFRRQDFPWVAVWEENCARAGAPWNGTAQVRGMEFGTTPMPLGREAIRRQGNLFETPCARVIEPGGVVSARYLAAIAEVPCEWRAITDVVPGGDALALIGPRPGESIVIAAQGAADFLRKGSGAK